jgi:hypothetical protein
VRFLILTKEFEINIRFLIDAKNCAILKISCFFCCFFLCNASIAQTEIEKRAGIAGEYFGAVILADEFSKTQCGRTASLSSRYTSVPMAVSEIKRKFPSSLAKEIDNAFSKNEENTKRIEMRELLGMMKLEKCDLAKSTLQQIFDKAANKWAAVR